MENAGGRGSSTGGERKSGKRPNGDNNTNNGVERLSDALVFGRHPYTADDGGEESDEQELKVWCVSGGSNNIERGRR